MKHIVKRGGRTEPYDARKLYASIYAACLSVREPVATAELIADKVSSEVEVWLARKSEINSNDIRKIASKFLKELNEHAAFVYEHRRVMW